MIKTKILVTGDRHYRNLELIADTLEGFLVEYGLNPEEVMLIHGGATGADTIADVCGKLLRMDVKPYPAHWRHTEDCPEGCSEVVGRAAGPIRNKKMITDHPDILIAFVFHDNLEESKGTKNMIELLKKATIPYRHMKL